MMIDRDFFLGRDVLQCSVCGDVWTHYMGAVEFSRDREDEQTLVRSTAPGMTARFAATDNPSLRRDAIKLVFSCEAGHEFYIDFIQHKGNTFVDEGSCGA